MEGSRPSLESRRAHGLVGFSQVTTQGQISAWLGHGLAFRLARTEARLQCPELTLLFSECEIAFRGFFQHGASASSHACECSGARAHPDGCGSVLLKVEVSPELAKRRGSLGRVLIRRSAKHRHFGRVLS